MSDERAEGHESAVETGKEQKKPQNGRKALFEKKKKQGESGENAHSSSRKNKFICALAALKPRPPEINLFPV